jgi:hypothetical protein
MRRGVGLAKLLNWVFRTSTRASCDPIRGNIQDGGNKITFARVSRQPQGGAIEGTRMMRWCFRCGSAVEAEGNNCPTCRSNLAAVHEGDRVDRPRPPAHRGFVEESPRTAKLSKEYGVPSINLDEFDMRPSAGAIPAPRNRPD